ncbi:MAG TPA: PRC-barrel domain-containing protein [Allosphingosinicella sp.]|nr:PRC-barrel domain-containing protein [Allosphingosinicella sp.]
MSDQGRYEGFGQGSRESERYDRDGGRERGRGGGFFGRGRDEDRGRDGGFFGGSRSSAADRQSRYGRDFDRDEEYFGYDDYHQGLPINETGRLIASNKVEGTPVYGRGGGRLGTIYNFMVDKYSGQVEYAVMSYGGFLGLGQRYYPLPWRILSYDTRQGGYRIEMSERDLERAPSFGREDEPRFSRDYGRRVNDWYGLNR